MYNHNNCFTYLAILSNFNLDQQNFRFCLASYQKDMEEPGWDLLITRSISNIDNKSIMVTNCHDFIFVI
jgi:hypothetical protein